MRIEINSQDLKERTQLIKKMLRPLVLKNKLFVQPVSKGDEYVASVRDTYQSTTNQYTESRFKTFVPDLQATYYERWYKTYQGKKEKFYLDRAYLHFYIIDKTLPEPAEKEFCLLHCDPNEPDDAAHAKYKQSLHLHIECSDASWPHCDVWPRAHIALNNGYLGDVLKDINSLTNAMKEAILMLKEEVLAAVKISD
jgi:hypothetical protein